MNGLDAQFAGDRPDFAYKSAMRARNWFAAVVVVGTINAAHGQDTRSNPGKAVSAKVVEVLDSVKNDADLARAATELSHLFDEVIANAPLSDPDSFREAAFGVRLASQLCKAPEGKQAELLGYLRKNDALAQALIFLIKPEDKLPAVYSLLDRLRDRHPDLGDYPALAAAICVVHDQPLSQRVNENKAEAPDPLEVFDYFKPARRAIGGMPPELLISVVDVTASIDELRWAGKQYAGDSEVGKRYFDIKYDYDSFRKGTVKKVTAAGFRLQNILKHGGVCADQAYFAAQVGKSIGIPTAFISGRNAEVAHAWVGFLEGRGGRASWNFDSGHYEGYQGVRGETLDPQTRKRIPDSALSLLADASASNAVSRRAAAAMTDAALRLAEIAKSGDGFPAREPTVIVTKKPARTTSSADRLHLVEAALKRCPSHTPGWDALVAAAKAGELSYKDKKRWAEVLDKLCAGKYPDFTLDVLRPMVETVDDPREQSNLWDSLFGSYQNRPDLAAEVRFSQGAMWEKAGDRAKAWECYQDVIKRYADDGPFTVDAARRCERLLKDSDKERDITPMYAALWPRLSKPQSMAPEFQTQSNWFRVGTLYRARLESEGQPSKAEEMRGKLGIPKK
jgi:hypothetical protein